MKNKTYNQFQSIGRETLPILLKPLPDELLSSWIMRYSRELLTKSHTFCRFILKTENVWNRDIDLNASDQFITALSEKTFLKPDEVFKTTLRSYYPNLFVNVQRRWIIPIGIYHRTRVKAGLMVCPGCLRNDSVPYFRRKWRLSLSVVCPDCKVKLVERCPKCESPISFHRLEVGLKESILNKDICVCFKCSLDFRKARLVKAEDSVVRLQKHFYSTIDDGFNASFQYSHLYFDGIHQLAKIVNGTGNKFRTFDKEVSKRSGNKYKKKSPVTEFDKMSIDDRLLTISKVSWLLEKWPSRFLEVANDTRVFSSYLLRDLMHPPYWYWRVVMENAYVVHTEWRSNSAHPWVHSYSAYGERMMAKERSDEL